MVRQGVPILPGADHDDQRDKEFDRLLVSLHTPNSSSKTRQRRLIRQIEGMLLTDETRLSAWQKACAWFYLARIYLHQERYKSAFEALVLSERELPPDQPAALAHIMALKVFAALRQGHQLHAMLSCADTYRALLYLDSPDEHQETPDRFQIMPVFD